ncbi:tyrosinase [Auriscalpium vulgare]|uniref:Tyrosinase n=1 Tax=Auriscalpium vulgare TaxID=40419 RepID=A0ACB8RHH7_9AGAM|nr:tyrosinase [Auriscalpium vulgare]
MSHIVITGPTPGNTQSDGASNRREIHDLIKDDYQFSLYIQALTAMFNSTQQDLISFFQIGGIHGLPYVQWDGSGGSQPVQGSWGGYCTHGSILFPTWHRPYVALFEQILQRQAKGIAAQYTYDQDRWLSAAANLRSPFWDWARNSVPPAEVVSLANVTITTPDGKKTSVANPLIRYTFHPIDPSFPTPYSNWKTTLRNPTSNGANATTDVNGLISDLQSVQSDLTTSIYNLLTRVHTWPAFSNHTPGDGGSSSNSLEAIHDEVHGVIGGHMGDPAVAGFDPIFFLHHTNVDRFLSLWAALNPKVWVGKGPAEGGTYTIPPNATIDSSTPLTPFWETQSGYWSSAQTTSTNKFEYSYPEFNGLDLGNPAAVKTAIAKIVNQLYGGIVFHPLDSSDDTSTASASAAPVSFLARGGGSAPAPGHPVPPAPPAGHGQSHYTAPPPPGPPAPAPLPSNYYDWTARIRVKKYELGASFTVLLFLGAVPEDPAQWRSCAGFVGAHYAFVNSAADQCDNCRSQADTYAEGFVHLNYGISKHSGLNSYEPPVISPYLQRDLHWRVQRVDKTAVALTELPSLEVTVSATPVSVEPGADFPTYGEPTYHNHITHGREGGSRAAAA